MDDVCILLVTLVVGFVGLCLYHWGNSSANSIPAQFGTSTPASAPALPVTDANVSADEEVHDAVVTASLEGVFQPVQVQATPSTTGTIRLHVKTMAGDELVAEVPSDARIADVKRAIQVQRADFETARQRMAVLTPEKPGDEPWTVLVSSRSLTSYGIVANQEINLVMVDKLPSFTKVRGLCSSY